MCFSDSRSKHAISKRQRPQLFGVFHIIQKRQHLAQFVYALEWKTFGTVVHVKPLQAFVEDVSYSHPITVACRLTPVNGWGAGCLGPLFGGGELSSTSLNRP